MNCSHVVNGKYKMNLTNLILFNFILKHNV